MKKSFLFLLLATMVGFFVCYGMEGSFILTVFFSGILIGIFCINFIAPQDAKFLLSIFLTGYLLRIFLSLTLYFYSSQFGYLDSSFASEGFFIGDGLTYFSNGQALSNLWHAGIFPDINTFRLHYAPCPAISSYDFFNGFIIWLTAAKTPLIFFFLNSFLDSLSIVLIYLITVRLIGGKSFRYARYSSILYCFWPSIILWSTQNLKEPMCSFFIYVLILSVLSLLQRVSIWYIVCSVLASSVIFIIRPPMIPAIIVLFFIFYFILILQRENKVPYILGGALAGLVALWLLKDSSLFRFLRDLIFSGDGFNRTSLLNNLSTLRAYRTVGGSAIFPGFEYTSFIKVLFFVPIGIFVVFFMPFPWQIGSALQVMAVPEMLIFYGLFPFTIYGFLHCLRINKLQAAMIMACILIIALILGLVEGNVGTLFRHRSVIFGLCLIFTGTGIQLKKERFSLASSTQGSL